MRARTRRIHFTQPGQSTRWLAETNERNFCYEAAARLYREVGDEESAKRCDAENARIKALQKPE